jgi:hypothetical protein
MEWIEVKRALLDGQPSLNSEMLQPQTVKSAVKEIARLVQIGWIDSANDGLLQRIQQACAVGQCEDVWHELQAEQHPLFKLGRQALASQKAKRSKKLLN